MSSNKDEALYGGPKQHKLRGKEISSTNSLSFKSQLSSLVSASRSSSNPRSTARSKPGTKDDIFTTHNRNSKKRAAKDLEPDDYTKQRRKTDIGTVDNSDLEQSKRKMEEKARLYSAMKRGDYVGSKSGREENGLVDFDRKWAEDEARGAEESDLLDDSDSGEELIEYTDEFGRQRHGTGAQVAREQRRRRLLNGEDDEDNLNIPPSNLIFGNTVQSAAFNPDEPIARKMEELARKRDRSLTPPEDTHYDASKEVRSKGVGFYQFSKDKEGREREMDNLERERIETDRLRAEQAERKERRKKELEERRGRIRQKRAGKEADKFLQGLVEELQDPSTAALSAGNANHTQSAAAPG